MDKYLFSKVYRFNTEELLSFIEEGLKNKGYDYDSLKLLIGDDNQASLSIFLNNEQVYLDMIYELPIISLESLFNKTVYSIEAQVITNYVALIESNLKEEKVTWFVEVGC